MQSTSSHVHLARKLWSVVCNSVCVVTVLIAQRIHAENNPGQSPMELSVAHALQPAVVHSAQVTSPQPQESTRDSNSQEGEFGIDGAERELRAGLSADVLPRVSLPYVTLAQAHQAHRIILPVAVFVFMVTFGCWLLISVQNSSMKRLNR